MFEAVTFRDNFAELEERIISFWKKNKIFEKSLSKDTSLTWTFVDGPPFITGLPHYGSLLSSIPKDVFPRFWTMKGYNVRRVWGWDCHGLPAENKVENKLLITRKKDIEEKVGVKKFIAECKNYVSEVSSEWEWYIDHIARWVDFKNAYKTMDTPYMETVMWVFKQLYDKQYIYKGLRVSLYCPHCSTPISNFEVAMDADNYKDITESSTTYKYQLQDEKNTYLLAWSTTPWNKLATPALAVNKKLTYIKVKQGNEYYILAKTTRAMLKDKPYTIVDTFKGSKLLGKKFVPHYNFYTVDPDKKAFVVINGDFVDATEGTGIVTIAAYGEDDLKVMQENNIQIVLHVDDEGILKKEVPKWGGMYYLKANKLVNNDLAERGLMYSDTSYTHRVPTCWRCHTRLFHAPQDAWYVDIQKLKPKLIKHNKAINWIPRHFKYGRFLKSMEAAPDWCISRSRYWGSPVPVWECDCGERVVIGSIKELEKLSGKRITDLHKPEIDAITIPCQKCNKQMHRVSEVLDSWIEAGSAPYAERHYPFEKNLDLTSFFPSDFIVEYTGQIRAWFYVLHVLGVALFGTHAFKNVLVTGVILGTDGRKMSKNYGNYPDPKELLQKYGGDALRIYLLGSPVMRGEDIRISEEEYRNQVRGLLLMYWNIYKFFVTYARLDGWKKPKKIQADFQSSNILDQWILSKMRGSIIQMTQNGYEKYDTPEIVHQAKKFLVDDVSTWYVRRIRDRVGLSASNAKDKNDAHQTLWTVLVEYSKALAPIIPFITEEIYRNLTEEQSVHLASWWDINTLSQDKKLEDDMLFAITIASKIHAFRKKAQLKVRMPLKKLFYKAPHQLSARVLPVVLDEVNVYALAYKGKAKSITVSGSTKKDNQDVPAGQARELVRNIQILRKKQKCDLTEKVTVAVPQYPKDFERYIKKKALVKKIIWGEKLSLSTG